MSDDVWSDMSLEVEGFWDEVLGNPFERDKQPSTCRVTLDDCTVERLGNRQVSEIYRRAIDVDVVTARIGGRPRRELTGSHRTLSPLLCKVVKRTPARSVKRVLSNPPKPPPPPQVPPHVWRAVRGLGNEP
jgi:hypothetical protein